MKRICLTLSTLLLLSCWMMAQNKIFSSKYDEKINQLITKMTLEEKVFQLASQYPNANARLGIPNLSANECLHGVKMKNATVFPQAIAMASTWDEDLIEKMGNVVAKESRAYGIHHCFTPMLSVVRDARWGRTEESYGEDPFLVGCIGSAYINGLQGKGANRFDKDHIIATAKHFVVDGEPMAGANGAAMDVSDYNLYNIHLYPFRMAIEKSRVGSIMPAHHLLNGVPCHGNKYLLVDVLRNQMKWDGLIVSDNNDIKNMVTNFGYAANFTDIAKRALEVGVHEELAMFRGWDNTRMYGDNLIKAVQEGKIPVKLVDDAVFMVLKAKYNLGLFESDKAYNDKFDLIKHPEKRVAGSYSQDYVEQFQKANYYGVSRPNLNEVLNDPTHARLALDVAHKSIILLKNQNSLLPLDKNKIRKVAVIGPNANCMRVGGYSGAPKYFVTVFDGIKKLLGSKAEVSYAKGCEMASDKKEDFTEAVTLAQQSDVAIVVVGGSEETCRENEDIDNLDLTGNQTELVKAVQATGKPCVVILLNGRPQSIGWIAENVPAVIEGWYLGQETGTALADVLFGVYNPSGKLPITFPRNVGQVPLFYNKMEPGRPRRIFQSDPSPLYPFGYGLSYTQFKLSAPTLANAKIAPDGKTTLSVSITNTGKMDGEEVVQLYVHDLISNRVRPAKELRGFKRVAIKAGETQNLSFEIGKEQLEYWNGGWVVEPGDYQLMVGTNSVNLQSVSLKVE
ncbi:MAG: glycoside hydrolase family 3 C-terminal domain-containing protein [Bacteroidota bacterium]|nr:glycoside hydrolase family 3 C-terminal domain-containing protein [Bacteroidota bacterium]